MQNKAPRREPGGLRAIKGLSSWQSFAHYALAFKLALGFLGFIFLGGQGCQGQLGLDHFEYANSLEQAAFGFFDQIGNGLVQSFGRGDEFRHGGGLRYALAYCLPLPAAQLGLSNPGRPIRATLGGVDPPAFPTVLAVGAGVKARAGGAGS